MGDAPERTSRNDVRALLMYVEHWKRVAEDHRLAMVESDRQRDKARAEAERLRNHLLNAPYCSGCGRANMYAPTEIRQRLHDHGVATCLPSDCPNWTIKAQYDHAAREWVSLGDLNDLPTTDR